VWGDHLKFVSIKFYKTTIKAGLIVEMSVWGGQCSLRSRALTASNRRRFPSDLLALRRDARQFRRVKGLSEAALEAVELAVTLEERLQCLSKATH
jgi:hypothetical protein